jgi:hypothetical protein
MNRDPCSCSGAREYTNADRGQGEALAQSAGKTEGPFRPPRSPPGGPEDAAYTGPDRVGTARAGREP